MHILLGRKLVTRHFQPVLAGFGGKFHRLVRSENAGLSIKMHNTGIYRSFRTTIQSGIFIGPGHSDPHNNICNISH